MPILTRSALAYLALTGAVEGRLSTSSAAALVGTTERHVWRMLRAYRDRGPAGLVSGKRGRPSNRRTPEAVREGVMAIVRARYADFGPTLAAEKLAELHQLHVSRETLRKWMIDGGLWVERRERKKRIHQPRIAETAWVS